MRFRVAALPLSALLVATAAAPALSAEARPAAGTAASTVTLLTAKVGDQTASVLQLALNATTLDRHAASVDVTPIASTATGPVGKVSVTPNSSPVTVAASQPVNLANGLVQLASPALNASAATPANAAAAEIAGRGIGAVSVLGLPLSVGDATLRGLSTVDSSQAQSTKTFTLTNLALPSLADLLNKLGLDLSALPVDTLNGLITSLKLGDVTAGALGTANAAIDTAQVAVTAAQAQLAPLTSTLTAAKADQASKTAAAATAAGNLTAAAAAVDTAIAAVPAVTLTALGLPVGLTSATMTSAQQTVLATIPTLTAPLAALDAAKAADAAAKTALAAANAAVAAAQAAVDAAQAALTSLVNTLTAAVDQLAAAVTGILDGTPLVSLGSIDVTSKATAASAGDADITGTVTGLNVAGTDVLQTVTGGTAVELTALTTTLGAQVQGALDTVTGTLSDVLDGAVPGLTFPAPQVSVMEKVTETGTDGAFSTARAALTALRVGLPAVSIPAAVALPNVLPVGAAAVGTPAIDLQLLTLADVPRFRPAVLASAPGTNSPGAGAPGDGGGVPTPVGGGGTLPDTGVRGAVALVASVLVGGGLLLARRRSRADG